jgi:phage-related protein
MNPETAKAATGMDKVAGAAKGVTDGMAASPAQQWDSIMRTLTTTLGEMLLPALRFLSGLFKEHPGLVQALVPLVLALAAGLAIAAAAQWAMNSAMLAWPGTWIILAILAVVVALVTLWRKNEAFRNFVKGAWSVILGAITGVWNWVKRNWPLLLGILTGPIGLAVLVITRNWDGIVRFFAGIPGRLAALGKGMWSFITDGLKGALNGAIGLVNAGIWTINSELIQNANRIPGVNIPYIPYIPYLAEGGITTGPTMAMIGEGSEDEAVMPLSKLQSVIDMNTAAGARSASRMSPAGSGVLQLRGGSRLFREFLQESVQTTTGGDIIKYVQG